MKQLYEFQGTKLLTFKGAVKFWKISRSQYMSSGAVIIIKYISPSLKSGSDWSVNTSCTESCSRISIPSESFLTLLLAQKSLNLNLSPELDECTIY